MRWLKNRNSQHCICHTILLFLLQWITFLVTNNSRPSTLSIGLLIIEFSILNDTKIDITQCANNKDTPATKPRGFPVVAKRSRTLRNINIRSLGAKKHHDILDGKKSRFICFRRERGAKLQPPLAATIAFFEPKIYSYPRGFPRVIVGINIWCIQYMPAGFHDDGTHKENRFSS